MLGKGRGCSQKTDGYSVAIIVYKETELVIECFL
jgi:hypothetical protein